MKQELLELPNAIMHDMVEADDLLGILPLNWDLKEDYATSRMTADTGSATGSRMTNWNATRSHRVIDSSGSKPSWGTAPMASRDVRVWERRPQSVPLRSSTSRTLWDVGKKLFSSLGRKGKTRTMHFNKHGW